MADDFDIEALLEAPFNESKKNDEKAASHQNGEKSSDSKKSRSTRRRSRSRDKGRHKSRSRSRKRSTSKKRGSSRHRSRSRRRSRSPHHSRHHKDRKRSRSRDGHSSKRKSPRSSSRDRRRRKRSLTPITLPGKPYPYRGGGFRRSPPPRLPPVVEELTPEERDARTIFCMQLSQRIRAKDLEEFFSSVGKVRDVRLITCNKTRRFKGIAYIEFKDPESVALALGLNGQKLLGIPIIVQPTQAEKNRIGNSMPNMAPRGSSGPTRLYVGSLHFNITEEMLRGIFEPFGKIDSIQLVLDQETGRSKCYGFVTYHNADDAKKALEQMNGFELAGRPLRVNNVSDRHDYSHQHNPLDTDDLDRHGIDLGATGRLQLMYKLAEGTGMQIPAAAASALNLNQDGSFAAPIATQCFMLANMFDPSNESVSSWDQEIMDDVVEECSKHGGCVHVYVDKISPQGNVYVKCPTVETAIAAVNSLHGRWFGGRVITAAYVPIFNYHNLFPETIASNAIISTSRTRNY